MFDYWYIRKKQVQINFYSMSLIVTDSELENERINMISHVCLCFQVF